MDWELLLRFTHVIGACVLLGTGAGIAFFMVMANRSRDPFLISHTASIVVIADLVFTATAVIIQPISGLLLAVAVGWSLTEGWIVTSIILYVVIGLCWIPVVWIQLRLRDLARVAAKNNAPLPANYDRLFRIWFVLGIPAFLFVLTIVWLMLARPDLGF